MCWAVKPIHRVRSQKGALEWQYDPVLSARHSNGVSSELARGVIPFVYSQCDSSLLPLYPIFKPGSHGAYDPYFSQSIANKEH